MFKFRKKAPEPVTDEEVLISQYRKKLTELQEVGRLLRDRNIDASLQLMGNCGAPSYHVESLVAIITRTTKETW